MLHGEPLGSGLPRLLPGLFRGESCGSRRVLIRHGPRDHLSDVPSIGDLPNGFLSVTVQHFLNHLKPEVLELLSLSHVFLM